MQVAGFVVVGLGLVAGALREERSQDGGSDDEGSSDFHTM